MLYLSQIQKGYFRVSWSLLDCPEQ